MTLTALQSRGRGGLVGKLLESGKLINCLYDYSDPFGTIDRGSETNCMRITGSTDYWALTEWASGQSCWIFDDENMTAEFGFNTDVVTYQFTSEM